MGFYQKQTLECLLKPTGLRGLQNNRCKFAYQWLIHKCSNGSLIKTMLVMYPKIRIRFTECLTRYEIIQPICNRDNVVSFLNCLCLFKYCVVLAEIYWSVRKKHFGWSQLGEIATAASKSATMSSAIRLPWRALTRSTVSSDASFIIYLGRMLINCSQILSPKLSTSSERNLPIPRDQLSPADMLQT